MFHLYRSNRLEELCTALSSVIEKSSDSAIEAETVVIQSRSMQEWIRMELSRRSGICANMDFPFPHPLVKRIYNAIEGRGEEDAWLEQGQLLWHLTDQLDRSIDLPQFKEIASYLEEDSSGTKRYQLAKNIALLFDKYSHFRPGMVTTWDNNPPENWQASLWHSTITANGIAHPAAVEQRIRQALESNTIDFDKLPGRLSLFGIPALSPLYLKIFEMLSQHIEVHLFLLSPCRENQPSDEIDNQLLSSLGKIGRDFHSLLEKVNPENTGGDELFIEPAEKTALATLQTDLLELRKRGPGEGEIPPVQLEADDNSISIHSCHSPMREVEVLRDQLLALFEENQDLEPRDVGVIIPSLETYAPYIKAVFGARGKGRPSLPYRISDVSASQDAPVVDTFLGVLNLASGRATSEEVLSLLESEAVRDRFEMTTDDIETIENWIEESGIRWGIDAEHREELGQPPFENNSWRFGLDRMLLGVALREGENTLWEGRLPCHLVEGTRSTLLGKLSHFCETLFTLHRQLRESHTVKTWKANLERITSGLCCAEGDYAQQHQVVRDSIDKICGYAEEAGFEGEVSLNVIHSLFNDELVSLKTPPGRLGSGVTFCPMAPMRSIPFRVVCLMGMNDGEYPGSGRAPGFDLTQKDPHPGDSTRRDEDRFCFLEALLSARDKLLITYCGQNDRNDQKKPPSVVVSELLDVLADGFIPGGAVPAAEDDQRNQWITGHPLQPFSPRYFDPSQPENNSLFSYSSAYCEGASSLRRPPVDPEPFFTSPLEEQTAAEEEVIRLDDLLRFFKSPAKFFAQNSLKISAKRLSEQLDEREPIELDHLARYKVGDKVLSLLIDNFSVEEIQHLLGASGQVPAGTPGTCLVEKLAENINPLAAEIKAIQAENPLGDLPVDQDLGTWRLQGRVGNIYPDAMLRYGYTKFRHDRLLQVWIEHLVLCSATGSHPKKSQYICRKSDGPELKKVHFREVGDPETVLKNLLALYTLGQSEPLLFFPKSSSAYWEIISKAEDESEETSAKALDAARSKWIVKDYGTNECLDFRQLFRDANPDPLDEDYHDMVQLQGEENRFGPLAETIFGPLYEHTGEKSG